MVIHKQQIDNKKDLISNSNTQIYACIVQVDASESIASVIAEINDNSWISKLNIIEQVSYTTRLKETAKNIMKDCLTFNTELNCNIYDYSVVGEYIVSKEGRKALIEQFSHSYVPLAELWKEKSSNNPGFDFHSESTTNLIIFGEAKYDSTSNPHGDAIDQVEGFITKGKDAMELTDLKHFVSTQATTNFLNNKKGFAISFSINSQNPKTIINNAISSEKINNITNYDEFYIVGVIINDK